MKQGNPANYMKACLVNNNIFHSKFDATLADAQSMKVAQ